jgi:hypothetical protein
MAELPASVREAGSASSPSEAKPVVVPQGSLAGRVFRNVRVSLWRAFQHDAFGVAKGAAYSSILTLFPVLMIVASILVTTANGPQYVSEITAAAYRVLPPGMGPVVEAYFKSAQERPVRVRQLPRLRLDPQQPGRQVTIGREIVPSAEQEVVHPCDAWSLTVDLGWDPLGVRASSPFSAEGRRPRGIQRNANHTWTTLTQPTVKDRCQSHSQRAPAR